MLLKQTLLQRLLLQVILQQINIREYCNSDREGFRLLPGAFLHIASCLVCQRWAGKSVLVVRLPEAAFRILYHIFSSTSQLHFLACLFDSDGSLRCVDRCSLCGPSPWSSGPLCIYPDGLGAGCKTSGRLVQNIRLFGRKRPFV